MKFTIAFLALFASSAFALPCKECDGCDPTPGPAPGPTPGETPGDNGGDVNVCNNDQKKVCCSGSGGFMGGFFCNFNVLGENCSGSTYCCAGDKVEQNGFVNMNFLNNHCGRVF
ncbi:hypothetical protein MAJ_07734, partial [Metarhizium majus ARSEF 297]